MTTPDIPTEALEAADQAYSEATYGVFAMEHEAGIRAAVLAAAPHLIAEGRRQAAEAIRAADLLLFDGGIRYDDRADNQAEVARIAAGSTDG